MSGLLTQCLHMETAVMIYEIIKYPCKISLYYTDYEIAVHLNNPFRQCISIQFQDYRHLCILHISNLNSINFILELK